MAGNISSNDSVSDVSRNESEDLEIPDLIRLRPYDMEPRRKLEEQDLITDTEDSKSSGNEEEERIGNNNWCVCGNNCRAMETYTESLCCQETNEIPEHFFQGESCISKSSDFRLVCLARPVLETALSAMNNLRGDSLVINNKTLRYAAYKQYTFWVHNRLGKGVRKVIPSCALWAIRTNFPAADNNYVPFMEGLMEEMRLADNDESEKD